ncbi:MAG: ABC transporter permease [Anaerolineaceae bacterium]|nr:ABC transporter permease [Anaerolineaceae bacterium]
MTTYIVRRILLIPILLLGVTVLIFGMLQFLSPVARSALFVKDLPKSEEALDAVIKAYGLDDPLMVQYWHWLVGRPIGNGEVVGGILRGDFGYSHSAKQPVADMIRERFPATFELTLWGFFPIVLIGTWLGVEAAVHYNSIYDQFIRIFCITGASLPTFVFGLLVLMFFYTQLQWFPPGRISPWVTQEIQAGSFMVRTNLLTIDSILNGRFDVFLDVLRHMVLPILTLSYISWATFVRVTRSSMLEELSQDYMTTAKSKGVSSQDRQNKHAFPNAILPLITLAGSTFIGLMSGVVITETVFNYPGLGSAAAAAATSLDVIAVLGISLFNGTILIVANLIVDILYALVDPRIRYS